jgi:hypothetical protein
MDRAGFLVGLVLGAIFPATAATEPPHTTRVLFIGNSYTYFNNLPQIFAKLAEDGGQGHVETSMVAPGGWRLKDHWEKGSARKLLDAEKWDFVVLQEQSTLGLSYWVNGKEHVNSDAVFRPFAEKWAVAVHKKGATAVFFLTWAEKNTPEDQPALNAAYARVAKGTQSVISPVGPAWKVVRRDNPGIGLFSESHGSHPSPAGSYLAACVFYATIFHRSPLGLPSKIEGNPVNLDTEKPEMDKTAPLVDLSGEDAKVLQAKAWETWRGLQSSGGYPEISFTHPPAIQPSPAGLPLSGRSLEGTWKGTILFYPVGPVEMELRFACSHSCKTHLEIHYHSKDLPDESVELSDFCIQGSKLSFSDPKSTGVGGIAVRFAGVMSTEGELQGTAQASTERAQVLGEWKLTRTTP